MARNYNRITDKRQTLRSCLFLMEKIWISEQDLTRSYFIAQNKKEVRVVKELLLQTYTLVLPIVLGYIVWLLKNQKRDRDANSKGTMLLLRVQLIEYHSKYMQIGDIPSYAYENFCEMYEAYHALGGNGMITKMMHEIEELHLKKKGE